MPARSNDVSQTWLEAAFRDLGIRLDKRGFMPITQARRRLKAAKVFKSGKSHRIPGQTSQPTDGDYLWAALLSLRDGREFSERASRLRWRGSPRGMENDALVERYGEAVLPWLADQVRTDGSLPASPRCVLPCLMALGSAEALEVLLRIRSQRDLNPQGLVTRWVEAHGAEGIGSLFDLAERGNAAARRALDRLSKMAPASFRRRSARAVGRARMREVLGSDEGDLAEAILETLDAAAVLPEAAPLPWPRFTASAGHFEYHAIRLIGARSKAGDDWGVLFEVVQGDRVSAEARWPATIQQYTYGSRVAPGGRYLEDSRPLALRLKEVEGPGAFVLPRRLTGITVANSRVGSFALDDALAKSLDLRPGRSSSGRIESWPSVLGIRAVLAKNPDAFWNAPKTAARALGLRSPEILVATGAFEHVVGVGGSNAKLRRLPSASPVFRSLAQALSRRDPELFSPGRPNLDWRRYAKKRDS